MAEVTTIFISILAGGPFRRPRHIHPQTRQHAQAVVVRSRFEDRLVQGDVDTSGCRSLLPRASSVSYGQLSRIQVMVDSRTLGYERPRAGAHKMRILAYAAWSQPSLGLDVGTVGTISAPAALDCVDHARPPDQATRPALIQTPVERRVLLVQRSGCHDWVLKEVRPPADR